MGLRLKFNIVLALVFAAGMAVSAWVSYELLQRNAKHEVLSNAGLMMEAALAVRGYTVQQVKPLIEYQLAEKFLPQSVPAYAASETFNALRKKYPDFMYKEALLNPTNPRNKAEPWEAKIVEAFKKLSPHPEGALGGGAGRRVGARGQGRDEPRYHRFSAATNSAIWTALSAAPLRRLSLEQNSASALSAVSSARMRPTYVGSWPAACSGVGTSVSTTPGAVARISTACAGVSGRAKRALICSE